MLCARPRGWSPHYHPHPTLSVWLQLQGLLTWAASWAKVLTSTPGPTLQSLTGSVEGRQQRGYFWWLLSGFCSLGLLLSQFSLQQGSGGIAASRFILAPLLFRLLPTNVQSPRPGLASPDTASGCRLWLSPPFIPANPEVTWAVLRGADGLAPFPSQVPTLTFS